MGNGITKEDLVALYTERNEQFRKAIVKRTDEKPVRPINLQQFPVIIDGDGNAQFVDSTPLEKELARFAGEYAAVTLLAFMDVADDTTATLVPDRLTEMEHRIAKLEWRLSQLLPPTWPEHDSKGDINN